jgi:hypothetical protein
MGRSMEQIPLDFNQALENKPLDINTAPYTEIVAQLDCLSSLELRLGYQRFVGKDPTFRDLSDEELRSGIRNPATELLRLGQIDQAEDQDERRSIRAH